MGIIIIGKSKIDCIAQLNVANANELLMCVGDLRVDENIALTSLHALFMREHNRVARALHVLNPKWSSETLYQEARKIVGAYNQVKTLNEKCSNTSTCSYMKRRTVIHYQPLLSLLDLGD